MELLFLVIFSLLFKKVTLNMIYSFTSLGITELCWPIIYDMGKVLCFLPNTFKIFSSVKAKIIRANLSFNIRLKYTTSNSSELWNTILMLIILWQEMFAEFQLTILKERAFFSKTSVKTTVVHSRNYTRFICSEYYLWKNLVWWYVKMFLNISQ